ncbi:hypothetical protein ILUMI_12667 [Ignelater luminosus]|uniref:Secreted protein n=1 Tax=Ignelater luminosus TaxID=2038154 RepID=A0A8K0CY52_IGNLU|nr:hypothetical protein ILUMI_12667 [Ignelater luminosus]
MNFAFMILLVYLTSTMFAQYMPPSKCKCPENWTPYTSKIYYTHGCQQHRNGIKRIRQCVPDRRSLGLRLLEPMKK